MRFTAARFMPKRQMAAKFAAFLYIVVGSLASTAWAERTPGPLNLEDLAKPLVEKQSRSEPEADRVAALAHFATARTLQQRGLFAPALQHYARADRLAPSSAAHNGAILLATHKHRLAMAARYAVKGIDPSEVGSAVVRRLAAYLTNQFDIPHAIELYKKALAAPPDDDDDDPALTIAIRMEIARLCMVSERYGEAAEQFAEAQDAIEHPQKLHLTEEMRKALLGEPALTYLLFAEAYLMADRLPQATAAFRKANELKPNAAQVKYNQARVELKAGHAKAALALLQKAFDEHIAHEANGPYQLLADILKKLGEQSKLTTQLETLYKSDADNAALGYFLAEQYAQTGQKDKAAKLYETFVEKNPSTELFRKLAEIYREEKRYDMLLAVAGKAINTFGTLEALEGEAKKLTSDAALFQSLVDAGGKVQSVPPALGYGEAIALGLLAQEHKKFDKASKFFDAALKIKPDQAAETLTLWAVGLMFDEHNADAVEVLKRGLDPKLIPQPNAAIEFYLAGALAMNNRTDEALAAADRAMQTAAAANKQMADKASADKATSNNESTDKAPFASRTTSARFASRKPWILDRAKRYQEARRAYEALIARYDSEPDNGENRAVLREARLSLSAICVNLHDMPAAEEWLEQVLDEFPDDVGANNDLGYLWADENKHLDRALAMIQTAVAAEPDNFAYRDSLGWVYYRLGRSTEAIAELRKAVNDKLPDGAVLDHLAEAYRKAGQVDQARQTWQKALGLFQKEGDQEKIEETKKKLENLK